MGTCKCSYPCEERENDTKHTLTANENRSQSLKIKKITIENLENIDILQKEDSHLKESKKCKPAKNSVISNFVVPNIKKLKIDTIETYKETETSERKLINNTRYTPRETITVEPKITEISEIPKKEPQKTIETKKKSKKTKNIKKQKQLTQKCLKPKKLVINTPATVQSQIIYVLPESLARREDIKKYYNISSILLGVGGSSKIFMANNAKNEQFAIKQVLKGGVAKPDELLREAKISRELKHKNIIKYYEIFEDISFIYFVMELGDGGDLFDFITAGENMCLSSDVTIELLIQMLEAVDYLHTEKKIIHRDLKPENFLIKIDENNNPIIKLIDFGLSINMPDNGQKLTEIIGTRKYASPEMILGYGYSEKIDEWAIGVVMFCMLTGYEPFRRTGEYQVEDSIVGAKIDFEIIEDPELRALNERFLDRFEISRITCKEALGYLKELKQIRDVVYNDQYFKYQKNLFIENYKLLIRQKLYGSERMTV